ncbi:MAG: hypothetical protein LBM93_07160, partial [Oscillospiraceae bacterium]|nr:hypothetical protein [Oscillospiraceae bacterium]
MRKYLESESEKLELVGENSKSKMPVKSQKNEVSVDTYDGDIEHLVDISIDYFEMLNLSRDLTNDEVNRELKKSEIKWLKRRDAAASEMAKNNAVNQLSILSQAKLVFQCEESREDYIDALDLYKRKELEREEEERQIAEQNKGISAAELSELLEQKLNEKLNENSQKNSSNVDSRTKNAFIDAIETEFDRKNYDAAIDYCVKARFE